jgi:hypothetical protein
MGREQRRSRRRRIRLKVWLKYGVDPVLVPCTLADISDSGARLSLADNSDIPSLFVMYLTENGGAQRDCRIVWRSPKEIGVQFIY